MEGFNNGCDLFYENIFNQYGDKLEGSLNSVECNNTNIENNIENMDIDTFISTPVNYTNKILLNDTKDTKNKKKFKPPIKNCSSNKDIVSDLSLQNNSVDKYINNHTNSAHFKTLQYDTEINNFNKEHSSNVYLEEKTNCSNAKFSLEGILLTSFDVLYDQQTNNVCHDLIRDDEIREHGKPEQYSMKRTFTRSESFSSVISLNKNYKDLDMKSSCESIETQIEDGFLNCQDPILGSLHGADCNEIDNNNNIDFNQNVDHEIPTGDDFLNLFKNRKSLKKFIKSVPMSTKFGDIGLNVNYSNYIKEVGHFEDAKPCDVVYKILEMYPMENEIYLQMTNKT